LPTHQPTCNAKKECGGGENGIEVHKHLYPTFSPQQAQHKIHTHIYRLPPPPPPTTTTTTTTGVSKCGLAIYIKKYHKKAKEELSKTQIFHHAKI
jgi:hypothetical protein